MCRMWALVQSKRAEFTSTKPMGRYRLRLLTAETLLRERPGRAATYPLMMASQKGEQGNVKKHCTPQKGENRET